jgi:hypothetical protein
VKRETCEKGAIRSSKFEVRGSKFRKPRTSDIEPLRLARLARPASLARLPCGSALLVSKGVRTIELLFCLV